MRSFSRVLAPAALAITLTATGLASAGDTSTAEHLFKQGLEAMKRNQFKEACDAFAGSNEADPSPGTEINLALCNEKQGKLASAWGWYRTAAGLAEQRGQKERAELARNEATKLEPKLHKLVVTVKTPVEGLVVTRNGAPVPTAVLGTDVPIDPGEYTVEVSAKGKTPWKQAVRIPAGPGVERLDVPALEDAPVTAAVPVVPPATTPGQDLAPPAGSTRDGTTQRNIGFVVGGAGIVSGVVAIALEFLALREDDKAKENAKDAAGVTGTTPQDEINRNEYLSSSKSHSDAAKSNETGAIVLGASAVVLIGVGITLVLTAPSGAKAAKLEKTPRLFPLLGSGTAGLGLSGSF